MSNIPNQEQISLIRAYRINLQIKLKDVSMKQKSDNSQNSDNPGYLLRRCSFV